MEDNVKLSPKKLGSRRAVEHYSAALGDGTVMIDIPVCPDRPRLTEAYTMPAKREIDDTTNGVLAQEGYFLTVGLVAHTEINVINDEPVRNSRGYLMKVVAAQSDDVMTPAIRRRKLNTLTAVSSKYILIKSQIQLFP